MEGMLGCPVCGAEYHIRDGVADFDRAATADDPSNLLHGIAATSVAARDREPGPAPGAGWRSQHDSALELAAYLGLTSDGGSVLLGGAYASLTGALLRLVLVHVVTIDYVPSTEDGPQASAEVDSSILRVNDRLPLRAGTVRAAALAGPSLRLVEQSVTALSVGGRLLVSAPVPVPYGIAVVAEDASSWIGERTSEVEPSAPVALSRAR